jgi:hypothetical protein
LAYFDWGLDGVLDDLSGINLDDRALWAASNPAFGTRISEEFVAIERDSLSPAGFARERLGVWPRDDDGAGQIIDYKQWLALAAPEPETAGDVCFAVDVTPSRSHSAIAAFTQDNVAVIDYRSGTDWVVERLVELKSKYNPLAIGLDGKGPASSLLLDLDKVGIRPPDGEPKRGDLAVTSAQDMAQACGQLVDAIRQGTVHHQGQPVLNVAVSGVKTRPLGDSWAWARRVATQDISPLVAVTLARWAYQSRVDLLSDYDVLQSVW